jgi:ketosteroid isomerase-like protein
MTDNELVVRRFYELFNAGDVEGAAGMYAVECEWDFPPSAPCAARGGRCSRSARAGRRRSRMDAWKSSMWSFLAMSSSPSGTLTGHGPARWVTRRASPTAERFQRRGCAVAEVRGGEIFRCRDYFDRANMYVPLGLQHLTRAEMGTAEAARRWRLGGLAASAGLRDKEQCVR